MARTGKRPVTKAMAATPYGAPQGAASLEEAAAHLLLKVPHTEARKRTPFERRENYGSCSPSVNSITLVRHAGGWMYAAG